MKKLTGFCITLFAALLTSCATMGNDVPRMGSMLRETTGQNGRACVQLHDIQSYGVLKNNVVSIDALRGYYLATVLPGCNDLDTSLRALFKGSFSEVCGGTTNKIATRRDSCTIDQMFEFKNRDEAFAAYNSTLEKRKELKENAMQSSPASSSY